MPEFCQRYEARNADFGSRAASVTTPKKLAPRFFNAWICYGVSKGNQGRIPRKGPEPGRSDQARRVLELFWLPVDGFELGCSGDTELASFGPIAYSGVTYAPVRPPSTMKFEAVTKEASSEAKNATAAAISRGSPNRPIGT